MCDVKAAMEHSPDALRSRTKQFALRVMRLVRSLPNTAEGRVIGSQVLRSATAIGANYRAAGRGRSRAEFAAKIGTVLEEADETAYWFELLVEGGLVAEKRMADLLKEAEELVKIFAAMKHTLRNKRSP